MFYGNIITLVLRRIKWYEYYYYLNILVKYLRTDYLHEILDFVSIDILFQLMLRIIALLFYYWLYLIIFYWLYFVAYSDLNIFPFFYLVSAPLAFFTFTNFQKE